MKRVSLLWQSRNHSRPGASTVSSSPGTYSHQPGSSSHRTQPSKGTIKVGALGVMLQSRTLTSCLSSDNFLICKWGLNSIQAAGALWELKNTWVESTRRHHDWKWEAGAYHWILGFLEKAESWAPSQALLCMQETWLRLPRAVLSGSPGGLSSAWLLWECVHTLDLRGSQVTVGVPHRRRFHSAF